MYTNRCKNVICTAGERHHHLVSTNFRYSPHPRGFSQSRFIHFTPAVSAVYFIVIIRKGNKKLS